jgi:hypothetical protein
MIKVLHIILALGIWGELAPLRSQVQPPKLTESYRGNFFDFNWVDKLDRNGKPFADYSSLSAEEHLEHLVNMNADSLLVFVMPISGYMFYDSKIAERHPNLKYDYLKEMIRLGHQRGIAMELYLPTMYNDRLVQKNPSWGIRNPDGSLYQSMYGGYHPDPNSPAADWYVSIINELVPAYKAQALFLDAISFLRYGQSEFTVKRFFEDTGRVYPKSVEEDPDWRATLRWEVAQMEMFWRKLRDAAKRRDPAIEVTFDQPGPYIQMPGSAGDFIPVPPHINTLADYAFTEAGPHGEFSTWMRGIVHPKPFRVTFLNRHSIFDPGRTDDLRARVGRSIAVGALIYHSDRTSIQGKPSAHATKVWGEVLRELQQKELYMRGTDPVKYVAIVSSEPTMLYRGRMDLSSHANDMLGAMRLLDALHIQYDVVPDWKLAPQILKPYQLIILPNTACMSDEQVHAIRQYVRDGGAVLATAESSLFDAAGKPRRDFALGDVFGVGIDEQIDDAVQTVDRKSPVYIHPGGSTHAIFRGLPSTELILPGDSSYVRAVQGTPLARLINDAGTPANAPLQATGRAAIHVQTFGKGKAVYICGAIFARSIHHRPAGGGILSASDGVRWPDTLVRNAIRYLAPKAPWELQSSQKIWAGLNHQPQQNRHVLHLVNWETDLRATNVSFILPSDSGVGTEAAVVWPSKQILKPIVKQRDRVYIIPEVGPHTMIVFSRATANTTGNPDRGQ